MNSSHPTIVGPAAIAAAVEGAIPRLACELPPDVRRALERARAAETDAQGAFALDLLCRNARTASGCSVPLCQDTGTVWVCLEIGPDVAVRGDVFRDVDDAVARAYERAGLRMSTVRDALLNRSNPGTNTPAFCELRPVDKPGATLHVMLKGGGSDNASRVVMLPPGSGRDGIVAAVEACVREKAPNACPPLVIGIGIGGTFDKVGGLAKHALLRTLGAPAADGRIAAFEAELLARANAVGAGAGGLGGGHTALAVHVETAPCHIAALPVAVNMGCSALRRISIPVDRSAPDDPDAWLAAAFSPWDAEAARMPSAAPGCGSEAASGVSCEPVSLNLPMTRAQALELKAGDRCLLTGPLYTLRDAGHMRLLEEMGAGEALPYGLDGQTIFYAGPTPPAAGRPFGAIGPTTASRMDFAAPALYGRGIAATIGKGRRSPEVVAACAETGGIYFAAVGGAAAELARCVVESETVAYADLGTEALRRVIVRDFPVVVAIDGRGGSLYG